MHVLYVVCITGRFFLLEKGSVLSSLAATGGVGGGSGGGGRARTHRARHTFLVDERTSPVLPQT